MSDCQLAEQDGDGDVHRRPRNLGCCCGLDSHLAVHRPGLALGIIPRVVEHSIGGGNVGISMPSRLVLVGKTWLQASRAHAAAHGRYQLASRTTVRLHI